MFTLYFGMVVLLLDIGAKQSWFGWQTYLYAETTPPPSFPPPRRYRVTRAKENPIVTRSRGRQVQSRYPRRRPLSAARTRAPRFGPHRPGSAESLRCRRARAGGGP